MQKKSFGILFNILALVIMIVIILIGVVIYNSIYNEIKFEIEPIKLVIFVIVLVSYIFFHELVHGLFYKVFTKQKLTFGLTLSCAFCGVPNIFVYRKTAMMAIIAPFVVFNIVFGISLFFVSNFMTYVLILIVFALHFGGCVGDLYIFGLLIFKFKEKDILMNDTGLKQTFYKRG